MRAKELTQMSSWVVKYFFFHSIIHIHILPSNISNLTVKVGFDLGLRVELLTKKSQVLSN